MTYIGIIAIAFGIAWWLFPFPKSRTQVDKRADLFAAFTSISDHVELVGTPEQKAALLTVLPAILSKGQA